MMSGPSIRKLYYSTAELCELLDIKAYDLKKWEKQFQKIKPSVSKTGRRLYKDHDIEIVRTIQEMTERGCTTEEIESVLNRHGDKSASGNRLHIAHEALHEIIHDLQQILGLLSDESEGVDELDALHLDL